MPVASDATKHTGTTQTYVGRGQDGVNVKIVILRIHHPVVYGASSGHHHKEQRWSRQHREKGHTQTRRWRRVAEPDHSRVPLTSVSQPAS